MYKIFQGVFFIILGGIFIVVGFQTYQKYTDINQHYVKTKGKVSKLEPVPDRRGAVYPKITFKDNKGKTHPLPGKLVYKAGKIKVGDALPVLYDPQQPQKAFLYNAFNLHKLPWLLMGTGLVLCLGGVLVLGYKKK